MGLTAGEFRSGGRIVDALGRDSLKAETVNAAPSAGSYISGGVRRDVDGRICVAVETLNAAVTSGTYLSGGRRFDLQGRLVVAVSAAALVAGEVMSGGEITDNKGRVVVTNETLGAAYSAGDYNTGGGARSSLGRRLVAGAVSGPFDPSSIAGLQAWYKADAGTSTTTDGVGVSQWNDQSGNANHLVQATGANQPLYKAAIQNGLPCLLFDATNDSMAATGVNIAQPDTVFAVVKNLQSGAGFCTIFDGATARQVIYREQTTDLLRASAGTDVASSATFGITNFHQISAIFNGASSQVWFDAASVLASNLGATALTSLLVGVGNAGTAFWNGYMAELLFYNSSLSAGNRTSVEGYLKTKWGTP